MDPESEKIAVKTRDKSFHLFDTGKKIWTREESLSKIEKLFIIDIGEDNGNTTEKIEGKSDLITNIINRIKSQIISAKNEIEIVIKKVKNMISKRKIEIDHFVESRLMLVVRIFLLFL